MPYCTLADLREMVPERALIRVTQDDDEVAEVDVTVVDRAIADADAEIDGYLRARYPVPLAPVPDLVRRISVTVTRYLLFSRRGLDAEKGSDKVVIADYRNMVEMLRGLGKGELTLGVATPAPAGGTHITSAPRQFSRRTMRDF